MSLIFTIQAQVQEAGVQDVTLGWEATEGYAHEDESAKIARLRSKQSGREDRQDVQQGTRSEFSLSGNRR